MPSGTPTGMYPEVLSYSPTVTMGLRLPWGKAVSPLPPS